VTGSRAPWVLLVALFATGFGLHDGFLGPRAVSVLLEDAAILLTASLGAGIVVAAGSIDLSIGSVAALGSLVAARLSQSGVPLPLAAACAVAVGALFGAGQGWWIARCGLPAFLVTVAGLFAARGAAWSITTGSIPCGPEASAWFDDATYLLPMGYRLTPTALVALTATAVVALWITCRPAGRALLATGGDAEAARLQGVDTSFVVVRAHAASGGLAALSGVMFLGVAFAGDAALGSGLELDALAAAVVGGIALSGGVHPPLAAWVGAMILTLIKVLIVRDGSLDASWARIVGGILLLLAAVASRRPAASSKS